MRGPGFVLLLLLSHAQSHTAEKAPLVYRIAGVVVDAMTAAPVPHAEVSVFAGSESIRAMAGDDGRFVFEGLASGKYPIYAAAPGYVREAYNQHGSYFTAVAVGDGRDSEHILFRLHRQAVIHGRVTDDRGDPVRSAQVQLFTRSTAKHAISLQAGTSTNDLGEYRFAHLLPGKYYIAVQAQLWYAQPGRHYLPGQESAPDPRLDSVYPITFYPGALDEHAAGELSLSAGETAEATIQLLPVHAVNVRLTNLPSGERGSAIVSAQQRVFGSFQQIGANVIQLSPAEYVVAGLPPGDIALSVRMLNSQDVGSRTIKVNSSEGGAPEISLPSAMGATANVSGRVMVPDGERRPETGQVTLVNEQNQHANAKLLMDGAFTFGAVQAGTYKVMVELLPGPVFVQKIVAGGAAVSGRQVIIEHGDVQLDITMGQGTGQVNGVVQLDGKPLAGAMVLMVSESGENLEDDSRMDQSDSDGTFALRNILPGKYVLMAIEDGWELDWMNSSVVKPYREKGQKIRIGPSETKEATVEAQRRLN